MSAILLISLKSAGSPNRSTAIMPLGVSFPSARVFSMVSSRALGLILNVSLYESTNTGVPPARLTLSPLAKNVNDGTKTASVFFTPYA